MKVLTDVKTWSKIIQCEHCGSSLQIDVNDVRPLRGLASYCVFCEACRRYTNPGSIPDYIHEHLVDSVTGA